MKMKTFSVILFICTICFPLSAMADTLYLNGVSGNVDLTGSGYISPYYGGNNPSAMDSIYCVDPTHDSYVGTNWNVNTTSLASADLRQTYLGIATDPLALTKYEEVAWLLFDQKTPYAGMSVADQQLTQAAIWWIISPGNPYGQNNSLVGIANQNYAGGDYSNVYILTDTGGKNQEFMIDPVPEPATVLLLGSGLVGLWWFRKRERVRKS